MNLLGKHFIAGKPRAEGAQTFQGYDPAAGKLLDPLFHEATAGEVSAALEQAEEASARCRQVGPARKAAFLRRMADEIEDLGDALIARASAETALPAARLTGERARTVQQLRLFAEVVEEGSWVGARIDTARPGRTPQPRPDLRRLLVPLGPVVVFGASNFPLAFSVAGGDTASALAAGCPVVCKAHPAHPGTSELVARAVLQAAEATGMPAGVFSLVHGTRHDVGLHLVRHPLTRAVGFTGSLKAGRVLFDAAASRPEPIPVYAEMGSINPVFLLPSALEAGAEAIAEGLKDAITLGVGQFCTNPGLIVGLKSDRLEGFAEKLAALITASSAGTMLYPGICQGYEAGTHRLRETPGVQVLAASASGPDPGKGAAGPMVFRTDARTFLQAAHLGDEVFGPSSLIVTAQTPEELEEMARNLEGQLTASVHAAEEDLLRHRGLIDILLRKVGRLIFNGFPTGVEVCPAMHHGGPYPATTDVRSTSVGTAAIERFVRPVCYQDFPDVALPPELQDGNPRHLWRLVDNRFTKEACQKRTG